jgi:hypothetical protein
MEGASAGGRAPSAEIVPHRSPRGGLAIVLAATSILVLSLLLPSTLIFEHSEPQTLLPDRAGAAVGHAAGTIEVSAPSGGAPGTSRVMVVANNPSRGWTLWTNATNPPARERGSLVDYPPDGGALLFGGTNPSNTALNDTWLFSQGVWTELCSGNSTAPACPKSPPNLLDPALAYDAASSEVVLFGGLGANSTWIYHGGAWSSVSTSSAPPGGAGLTMAYDPAIGAVVLFSQYGATWTFANGTWVQQHPLNSPSGRASNAFFYSPSAGGMILWGGAVGQSGTSETWEYAGNNWTQLTPPVHPPAGNSLGSADDAAFDYGVVLGIVSVSGTTADNTTWTFSNGTWTNATANLGGPLPASGGYPALAYDSTDGYVVEFGETCACLGYGGQTWLLRDPLTLNVNSSAAVRDLGQSLNYTVRVLGGIGPYSVVYPLFPPGCLPPSAFSKNLTIACALNQTGYFSLAANASDAIGVAVGVVLPLVVNPDPTVYAYADPNPTDVGIPSLLVGTSSGGTDGVDQSWIVGGGPSQPGSVSRVNFTSAGTIDAVFTAVDRAGFRVNTTVVVVVNAFPEGVIAASRILTDVGLAVDFAANQTGGANYVSEGWVFGDGSASAGLETTHVYRTVGFFTVGLWTNDSIGAGSFTSHLIQVNPALTATASVNDPRPLVNTPVNFSSIVAGGTGPDTYWWSFGDGSSDHTANPTHAYDLSGTYNATLVVNDSVGGNHSTLISIDAVGPPLVRISPPNVTINRGYTPTDLALGIAAAGVVGLALGVLIGRARKPPARTTP